MLKMILKLHQPALNMGSDNRQFAVGGDISRGNNQICYVGEVTIPVQGNAPAGDIKAALIRAFEIAFHSFECETSLPDLLKTINQQIYREANRWGIEGLLTGARPCISGAIFHSSGGTLKIAAWGECTAICGTPGNWTVFRDGFHHAVTHIERHLPPKSGDPRTQERIDHFGTKIHNPTAGDGRIYLANGDPGFLDVPIHAVDGSKTTEVYLLTGAAVGYLPNYDSLVANLAEREFHSTLPYFMAPNPEAGGSKIPKAESVAIAVRN